jgi:hypothetical protein
MALIWFLLCYGSKDRKNRSLTKEDRQPEQFRQRSEAKGSVAESLIHGTVPANCAFLDSARCTITLKLMRTVRIG